MNSLPVGRVLHIALICFSLLLSGLGKPGLASAVDLGTFLQNTLLGAVIQNGSINTAPSPGAGATYLKGVRLVGSDTSGGGSPSKDPDECASRCKNRGNCMAWTWTKTSLAGASLRTSTSINFCALKNNVSDQIKCDNCVSGYVTRLPPECATYAKEAVRQQLQNLKRQCGFRGSQWQADYQYHSSWCASGSNRKFIAREMRSRQTKLNQCAQTAIVPDLIGLPKSRAISKLSGSTVIESLLFGNAVSQNLKLGRVFTITSAQPEGTVVRQNPVARSRVDVGSSVDIWLSENNKVRVPDVVGSMGSQARITLDKMKLKADSAMRKESDRPDGIVLEQTPTAGTKVPEGTMIELVISRQIVVEPVTVPNLYGYQRNKSAQILREKRLELGKVGRKLTEHESGIVVAQSPKPGKQIKPGGKVDISLSIQGVRVPSLIQLSENDAIHALEQAGLKVNIVRKDDPERDKEVLGQNPDEGTLVKFDSPVKLEIAKLILIPVPDVTKMDVESAKSLLKKKGLLAGDINNKVSEQNSGTVLAQQPKHGSLVKTGTAIALTVADQMIEMPDITGLVLGDAEAVLAQHGLKTGDTKKQLSLKNENSVIDQNPKAGKKVKPGTTVALTLADQVVEVPDVTGLVLGDAKETLRQQGLETGETRKHISLQDENSVIAQEPKAGTRVKPGTAVILDLADQSTLILISAGTLLGLLVAGGFYHLRSQRQPSRSRTGQMTPVVRVSPHKDAGSSQLTSGKMKTADHEIHFNPVQDQGEQYVSTDADSTTQTGGKDE